MPQATSRRGSFGQLVLAVSVAVTAVAGCADAPESGSETPLEATPRSAPILVAHRGASAYAPEHTLVAYELGIAQGADYIEPDLQITSDGVLIALHDLTLERTTNIEEVFPSRFEEVEIRGELTKVWPVNDFTLEEIRTLDAGSWFDTSFAGATIPTFAEVIEVARGRAGLFIETKAPEVYGNRGFDMEELLLSELAQHGLAEPGQDPATPIIIQSFSAASLELLRHEKETRLPLALLIGGGEESAHWVTQEGLARAAGFATGIGPTKSLLADDPAIVARAHELRLTVVPWTFRARRPGDRFSTVEEEMAHFLDEIGVDGIITDNPDLFPGRSDAESR